MVHAMAPRQIFLTASGLWLAVLFFLLVVLVATWLGCWWAPVKAETEEAAEEPMPWSCGSPKAAIEDLSILLIHIDSMIFLYVEICVLDFSF